MTRCGNGNRLSQVRVGVSADRRGRWAEQQASDALLANGWQILARRFRTSVGEIDLVVEKGGLVAFVEVKFRQTGSAAAYSVTESQRRRIQNAAELWLAANPGAGPSGLRFDVLVVDVEGRVRRIADAFRAD